MRALAHLEAHVPTLLEYDEDQSFIFGTPQTVEARFQKHVGEHIRRGYVTNLNRLLKDVATFCMTTKLPFSEMERWTDVVRVYVSLRTNKKNQKNLWLDSILVRPCFQGNGLLTLIVNQMLLCAQLRGDIRKVIIETCVPQTVEILRSKFGNLFHETKHKLPNCVFTHIHNLDFSLGPKIANSSGGIITLDANAFPTFKQLNRPEWVEETYVKMC